MTKNQKREEQHLKFIMSLGDRLMSKYTDGGPGLDKFHKFPSTKIGQGGRFARKVKRARES